MSLSTLFLQSFIKIHPTVLEKKSKMWKVYRRRTDGALWQKLTRAFRSGELKTWHLLPVKFSRIPSSGFREKVKNVTANQRQRRPSCFFRIGPKNTKLIENIWILLPVKFRLIPFSGFRGEVENVSANQRQGDHIVFRIGPKNTNLVGDVEILLPLKFQLILFSSFRGEVRNVSANQMPGRPSCFFSIDTKNPNLVEHVETCFLSSFVEFRSEEKSKMPRPIRG